MKIKGERYVNGGVTQHNGYLPSGVVDLIDRLILDAVTSRASDIHLESTERGLRVRYRIDGLLYDRHLISSDLMPQIISRIKVLARLNIAEKRVPLDGQFRIAVSEKKIDLRVSTFPAIHGEKVVIRILDQSLSTIRIDHLGLTPPMLSAFSTLICKAQGFILVTGPTGSGKTSSLYAAISCLNTTDKNIMTLEDPVEYHVEGIVQCQIHPEAGFTFAKGIRSLLRQDPDIALIGEIRDHESARIAIEAALTGHLVLSTLHTNDAPGAIMRLMDMGIEPFLINAAVTGVLAQRLVRKLCLECRYSYRPTAHEQLVLQRLGVVIDTLYTSRGCETCQYLGHYGRTGIFELLCMTNSLRALIVAQPSFEAIYAQACRDGMSTLMHDAVQKMSSGIISLQELLLVLS